MSAAGHSSHLPRRYDGVVFPALNRSPELLASRHAVPALMVLAEPSCCLLALALIVLACRCLLFMCRGQLAAAAVAVCLPSSAELQLFPPFVFFRCWSCRVSQRIA